MLNNLYLLSLGIGLFILSTVSVKWFSDCARKCGLLAIPNARSSHFEKIPQGAGLVFVLIWILSLLLGCCFNWFAVSEVMLFTLSPTIVSLLGFWDDKKELSAKVRLVVQIAAAIICVVGLGKVYTLSLLSEAAIYLGWAGIMMVMLALVWSTNLFNFMDGLDGLAAVEALFVLGVGGLLFWVTGEVKTAIMAWFLVATVAGFLVWNWPKARVFMGDVGSYALGFLIALFAIVGAAKYQIPIALWLILYGAFWFDATITLIRRFLNSEKLILAHREHAYQRLNRIGFSHSQVLCVYIVFNSILAVITLWASFHPDYMGWSLFLALGILTVAYLFIEKLNPMVSVK